MSLMNDTPRIRKGAKPHVYLREWRKHKKLKAVAMAERLEIERESYYRLEREPQTLSVAEVMELAEAIGIEPKSLWEPPPEAGKPPRPSLDAIVQDLPSPQVEGFADMLRRAAGK